MTLDIQLDQIRMNDAGLASQIGQLKNLESIVRWIPEEGLSLQQFDSIQQDEYNYDVLFPWHDHRWIVFGVT
jgi:hypothetical protein